MMAVAVIAAAAAGFAVGGAVERWRYDDRCLDLGGGRQPGDFPICVIDAR